MFGMRFLRLRIIFFMLGLLAQWYVFVRIRRAIRASGCSDRLKRRTVRLVGAAIALLFGVNVWMLFRPILWVDPPRVAQIGFFYPAAAWSFGSVVSALLLLLAAIPGCLKALAGRLARGAANPVTAAPMNPGRRRFLQAGTAGLVAAPLVVSGYGVAYASRDYRVEEVALPFGRSVRVVQLTDIHAGVYMTRDDMRCYADQVIALQPDLFVLTGDFISNSMVFLPDCVEEMARVRARYGSFATLGNHEHMWGRPDEVRDILERHRIPLLNNAHQMVQTDQGPFAVVGIDDLITGQPDLDGALRGLDPGIPTLLLSHRPEIFPVAASRRIPLTLAGHWHGGQIKLSLPGMEISFAHLWTPYPEGLYRIKASHLYVSRGIGTTFTPVRLNAPPEVTLFRLE